LFALICIFIYAVADSRQGVILQLGVLVEWLTTPYREKNSLRNVTRVLGFRGLL